MTDADALELVIARTRHERYRQLVLDRPGDYWPVVRALATGVPAPPPEPPAATLPAPYRLMVLAVVGRATLCRSCPTGCQRATCHAGLGDAFGGAPLAHCYACVTGAAKKENPDGRP